MDEGLGLGLGHEAQTMDYTSIFKEPCIASSMLSRAEQSMLPLSGMQERQIV